uniref:ATP synthase F0 subunit 8 n=1 Tax=Desis jiaxiangi TaxID=2789892 RepID=A0A8B0Z929_9ARAC|nr:ATP synthase F0 subunit 8 [Desis jiaxiangi]QTX95127.1 ATP synthase F0 subunit 8 [Desis jiaxiangi]
MPLMWELSVIMFVFLGFIMILLYNYMMIEKLNKNLFMKNVKLSIWKW